MRAARWVCVVVLSILGSGLAWPQPASAATATPVLYLNPGTRYATQGLAWAGSQWWTSQAQAGSSEGWEALTISRIGGTGAFLSKMTLVDSSHGAQIGVEVVGTARYVWVMWRRAVGDPVVTRVRFQPGATVTFDSPLVQVMPLPTWEQGTPIDPQVTPDGWLVTRHSRDGRAWFERRKVADVVAGVDQLYGMVEIPPLGLEGRASIYQGHTSSGDVIYQAQGMPDTPITITRLSWSTGGLIGVSDISTSLPVKREPEGMATSGAGRVFLGVVSGTGATRYPVYEVVGGALAGAAPVAASRECVSADRVSRPRAGVRVRVEPVGCERARVTVRVARPKHRRVRVTVGGDRVVRQARRVQTFRVVDPPSRGVVKVRGAGRDAWIRVRF